MRSFLPLATLLSMAFLLGCQEQSSSLVGLEGLGPEFAPKKCVLNSTAKGCDGDEEGGMGDVPADLTMSGGMVASGLVSSFLEGANQINFGAGPTFSLKFEMDATFADGGGSRLDECTEFKGKRAASSPDFAALFDKLQDDDETLDRTLFVHIDKNALDIGGGETSEESAISVVWTDGAESFNVSVGRLSPTQPGESAVTLDGDLSTGRTITFTGGKIRLTNKTGRVQERFHLICPIPDADVITMILTAATS